MMREVNGAAMAILRKRSMESVIRNMLDDDPGNPRRYGVFSPKESDEFVRRVLVAIARAFLEHGSADQRFRERVRQAIGKWESFRRAA